MKQIRLRDYRGRFRSFRCGDCDHFGEFENNSLKGTCWKKDKAKDSFDKACKDEFTPNFFVTRTLEGWK